MAGPFKAEVRAALRDHQRVSVAISAGVGSSGIKVLLKSPQSAATQEVLEPGGQTSEAQPHLTRREVQILRLIVNGMHNRQIAARIHRSIKTVEKHRQNLHLKLSTHEVAGLTRQAMSLGLIGEQRRVTRPLDQSARGLTPRELEVLKLVAQGSGNKWIACELHRSIKTVDHHRENIMKKLNIHDVAGLTSYALSRGLL